MEVHDPSGGVDKELGAKAIANAKAALSARGLSEAPANAKPDMIIDLEYGVGPGQIKIVYRSPADVSMSNIGPQEPPAKPILAFEKFLQLTGREPPPGAPAPEPCPARGRKRGADWWRR